MFRTVCLFLTLSACAWAQSQLDIVAAYYGSGRQFFDVTDAVRGHAQPDGMELTVGADALGGDPLPGVGKTLRVYFKWAGNFDLAEAADGAPLRIGRRVSTRGTAREGTAGRVTPPVTIASATYGVNNRTVDVTSLLQSRVQDNQLNFEVGGANLADPVPGAVKELVVTYQWQGRTLEARARDGEWLRLPPPAESALPGLKLLSATYGLGGRTSDVLGLLLLRVANDRLTVSADNNTLGGDPARGANKVLNVTYEWAGKRYTASAKEGQILRLPPDNLASATPAPAASTPVLPSEGVCFYPGANHQGAPTCYTQDQSQVTGVYASLRVFGRVRSVDLFEGNAFNGRTLRLTGDQADLAQVGAGGGFFSNSAQYTWAGRPGSLRLIR